MAQPDGRSPGFPADWNPVDNDEILVALISEIRNALIPARYHLNKGDTAGSLQQIQRVLDFTGVCSNKIKPR